MKVFEFDQNRIGSGHIFPPEIAEKEWIGYHGTSSFYSAKIERDGFSSFKPISQDQLDMLEELARQYDRPSKAVAKFLHEEKTVSFSPLSEWALHYTKPDLLGGQGVRRVKELADSIIAHKEFDHTSATAGPLKALIADIDQSVHGIPVVYAVNLLDQEHIRYDAVTHAVQASSAINKERIIAKVLAPNFDAFDRINLAKLKVSVEQLYRASRPHFIQLID